MVFHVSNLELFMTKSRLAIILATSLAALSMSASAAAAQMTNNASPVTTVFAPPSQIAVNYFTVDKASGSITNKDANAGLKEGTRIKLAVADYNQASAQFGSEISAKWNSITGSNHWTKPASAGQPVGISASLDSIGLKAKGTPASLFNTDKPQQRGLALKIVGTGDAISVANFAKPAIVNGSAQGSKSTFYVVGRAVHTHNLSARTHEISGLANSGGFSSPGNASG